MTLERDRDCTGNKNHMEVLSSLLRSLQNYVFRNSHLSKLPRKNEIVVGQFGSKYLPITCKVMLDMEVGAILKSTRHLYTD